MSIAWASSINHLVDPRVFSISPMTLWLLVYLSTCRCGQCRWAARSYISWPMLISIKDLTNNIIFLSRHFNWSPGMQNLVDFCLSCVRCLPFTWMYQKQPSCLPVILYDAIYLYSYLFLRQNNEQLILILDTLATINSTLCQLYMA